MRVYWNALRKHRLNYLLGDFGGNGFGGNRLFRILGIVRFLGVLRCFGRGAHAFVVVLVCGGYGYGIADGVILSYGRGADAEIIMP